MSRVEKFRPYREKIKNKNSITSILNDSSDKVNKFKKSLDDLNPKILSQYQPVKIDLMDFLSIDSDNNENTLIIQNFLNDLNYGELIQIREQADLLLLSGKNIRMYSEFEENWLNHDRGITKIGNCNLLYDKVQQDNLTFFNSSYETFERFTNVIDKVKKNQEILENKKIDDIVLIKNSKIKYRSFFTTLVSTSILLFILLITFIIAISV